MLQDPLISIITVTYNAAPFLEQTIQSVIRQTYPNVEYIIIDGGSTDGTVDVIKKYQDKVSYWVSEKDYGIYDAMNKGIAVANGELIGIVNASDYYEPNTVEVMVNAYSKDPTIGILHGDINMLNEDGTLFKHKAPESDLTNLYQGFNIFHPSFFVSKDTYRKVGTYNTDYRLSADYDFTLRCYLAHINFCYVNVPISNFRIGGASTNVQSGFQENKRILLANGVPVEKVDAVYKDWVRKDHKNHIYRNTYNFLRKFLPQKFVQHLSHLFSVR